MLPLVNTLHFHSSKWEMHEQMYALLHGHVAQIACRCRTPCPTPIRLRHAPDTCRRSIGELNVKNNIFHFRCVVDSLPTLPRHGPAQSQPSLDNPRFPASQNEHSSRHLLSVPRDASPQSTQRCRVSARRSSPDRRSAARSDRCAAGRSDRRAASRWWPGALRFLSFSGFLVTYGQSTPLLQGLAIRFVMASNPFLVLGF